MEHGKFISIEGPEGAGKTTLIRRIEAYLRSRNQQFVITREPGGTPQAEQIRDMLLQGRTDKWMSDTEVLLLYAARNEHIYRLIKPALSTGKHVITDRFNASTRAYQQAGGNANVQLIDAIDEVICERNDCQPDLTLVLDLPVEVGLLRVTARAEGQTRFESMGIEYHQSLRRAYLDLSNYPIYSQVQVLDASQGRDEVWQQTLPYLNTMLGLVELEQEDG